MSMIDIPFVSYPIVFGNNGTSILLDASEEFVAQVIRIPRSGTLRRIGWRSGNVASGYVLKLSIETMASVVGQPVATTNATKTLYAANAESDDITSLSSNTVIYTAINGTSGISVTAGDLVTITWRLLSTSGGSVNVRQQGSLLGREFTSGYTGLCYSTTFLGSVWTVGTFPPLVSLVYSDGFSPLPGGQPPTNSNNLFYASGTNAYTGIKFQVPYACRLFGAAAYLDLDGDAEVILYDSDEYTVMSGFPVALSSTQRANTSGRWFDIVFPVKPSIKANENYRLIVRATTSTTITLSNYTIVDDTSYRGYGAFPEGGRICLTRRSSAPSSNDYTWTDTDSDKPMMQLVIDGIDTGSGGGSGISRSRQVNG